MHAMTDWELIEGYVQRRSEEAFASLMDRYVDLVYSSAVRQVQHTDLAQDVTQAVFLLLARKASEFRPGMVLAGWLFRTTRFIAARAVRAEQRRHRRELEAGSMTTITLPSDSDLIPWEQIAPLLDRAMAALPEVDRNAVLLRFFAGKPLREVGMGLGLGEEATKKRVSRAIEKLRAFFRRHGVMVTATALTGGLVEHAVQAAPATISTQITAAMHAGASAATASPAAVLLDAAQRSLFYGKLRLAIGWGLAVALGVALSTVLWSKTRRNESVGSAQLGAAMPVVPRGVQPVATVPSRPAAQSTFSLTVVSAEDGTVLPEARLLVDWWNADQSNSWPVLETDTRGNVEFVVPSEPFDIMHFWISAEGRVPKIVDWHSYELSPGTTSYTVKLARGRTLSGSVHDQEGEPVAGATVAFSGPGLNLAERENTHFHRELSAVLSNEDGIWTMNQMPTGADIRIMASHPDFASTETGTWALPAGMTNVVLVLTNGFPVYGKVLTTGGEPVTGAMVCKETGVSCCTKTDPSGRFTWPRVEPGRMWLSVRAKGVEELNQSFQVTNGVNDIVLRVSGYPDRGASAGGARQRLRMVGSVVDADTQQPIPMFKVLMGDRTPRPEFADAPLSNGRFVGEGRDGRFDWQLNSREANFLLQVQADGYLPAVSAPQPFFAFQLQRSRTLQGVIRTSDSLPTEGAMVLLSGMGFGGTMQQPGQLLPPNAAFASTRTRTDSEGQFSLQYMNGAQGLLAVHRAGYAYVPISMATNARITLEPWGAIAGVLVVGGQPAPNQFVWVDGVQQLAVRSRFALSFSYRAKTDQNGRFDFACVPAGDHVVSRMVNYCENQPCSPLDSHTTVVAVRSGETARVELRGEGRKVIGRIALADPTADVSRGLSKAFLLLQDSGLKEPQFQSFEQPSDHWRALRLYNGHAKFPFAFWPDGTIRADDVPPGTYTLEIELFAATPDPINMEKRLGSLKQKLVVPGSGPDLLDLGTLRVQ
jgi:RNA polymerase sigma factor (sigma-70 family)